MIHLSADILDALCQHAKDTFPNECCGAILIRDGHEEVHRIKNVQNIMHIGDPQRYPRDARTAYLWDPEKALVILGEADSGKVTPKAFYHSHPNHDAYFSTEDKTQAVGLGDRPPYPDAVYVVISIYNRQVRTMKAFQWDEGQKDFVESELRTDV